MSTQFPVLYDRPINKWKVAELKEELKKRSLPVKGLKDELVRRLDEAIQNERENDEAQDESDSDDLKEHLSSGEGILSEKENLGAQGPSDLHHMEEPFTEYNHPIPPSCNEQMPVDAHKEDFHDAVVDNSVSGADLVDGSSEKDEGKVDGGSVSISSMVESGVEDNSGGPDNTIVKLLSGSIASTEAIFGNTGASMQATESRSDQGDDLRRAGIVEASLKSSGFLNVVVDQQVAGGSENGKNSITVAVNAETEVVPAATIEKTSDTGTEHLKPVQMDAKSHVTHSSSQVYEVSSNLGFQVQCESITTDNATLTDLEKTEIKENLNANNIQLEPEVTRQEIVQSLSHKESSGDDSLYALDDKVPDVKQGYVVEADDKCIIKSGEKTYSADNVSVIDQIMENNAPDQVADDNELVQSAANRILDETVKSDVPVERMESSSGNKPDTVASVGPRELQDDKSKDANSSDLVGLTTEVPLERMNLDLSAAGDLMEEDNILDPKRTDSDLNSNQECDKIKSTEITMNEALQADTPNISQSCVANNDGMVSSSEERKLESTNDTVSSIQADMPPQNMESSVDKKLDIEASAEQRELQDDKSSDANIRELVDVKYREPLEKINFDQSSADDSMEDDILDMKHTDSDYNPNKGGDETMSTEEITVNLPSVNETPQADIPANISVSSVPSSEKRKFEGEPAPETKEIRKRQRKWNEENVKMAEQKGLDAPLSKVAMASSSTDVPKWNGSGLTNQREVPPSSKTPTDSLRIDNFLRPFTLKAVQELLSKTGTHNAFWMDNIKTHCYVTYASVEEATATRNTLYNLQWPENGGRLLVAEFVDPEEVKSRLEAPAKLRSAHPPQPPAKQVTPVHPRESREAASGTLARGERIAPASAPVDEPIDSTKTLDDLFRKTKATPRIYYLPLSDEQVALKLGKQRN